MTIKEKINKFISEKNLTHSEIGRGFKTTQQNVSRFLGESGRIPLDFVVWLANEYPEIDLEKLIRDSEEFSIVRDSGAAYRKGGANKHKALEEISAVLDKYM